MLFRDRTKLFNVDGSLSGNLSSEIDNVKRTNAIMIFIKRPVLQ